jgi:hypothetical protein
LLPACAQAQQAPSVDELLPRLYAYAREYRAKLPSLSCDEAITSQVLKNGNVKKELLVEATLREVRDDSKTEPFTERRTFKTVDGRRPKPHFTIPFLVQGAFANAIGFVREDREACFDYRLVAQDGGATLRLDMALKPNYTDSNCKDVPEGYKKTVLMDAKTFRITHVDRTISAEAAKHSIEVYFFSTDFSPQKLGNETFWLPVKVYAHDAADAGRMYATYSNFHRFAGELKVLPMDAQPGEVR